MSESSPTNMHIVAKNLLRAFCKFLYLWFCVLSEQWKKHCVAKILLAILEILLYENSYNYDSYKFSNKFTFFFSFRTNQKQESNFQEAGGLLTKNIFVFCIWQVILYFKGIPSLYVKIILLVCSVFII